jgi:polysaccharide biosynthesis protein PslG
MRRALAGAAIAVAAGAALALPTTGMGAVAAIQDDILTTAPASQVPTRLQLVQKTKAKVSRFDVLWSFVATRQPADPSNPADPAYDWSHVDQVLIGLDKANITPIVSTYSTPTFAQATRATPFTSAYNPNAPTPAAFGAFMHALATRYNGTFPNPAGGTLPRVRHFEIWNEPNLKNFFRFGSKSNLGKYKALVKAAYPKIKSANRRAIVIAGVGGPRSSSGNGNVGALKWLKGLVKDKSVKFNAYSQHIYPSKGPLFSSRSYDKAFPTWNSLDQILTTLDKKKRGMKLYITEAGYTTAKTPFRNVKVSPSQQNAYLKQIFKLPDVKAKQIAAVVWFNLQDNSNWPGGLLTESGRKKPSYNSFVRIAKRPIPRALRSTLAN